MGMADGGGAMYPHVVVRYMATVYAQFGVKFVESEDAASKLDKVEDAFVVVYPQPYTMDEQLTPEARQALIDVVQYASQKSGHRLCAVFGKQDCVYLEPKGTSKPSAESPSGGIQCIQFPIRLKPT